MTRFPNIEWDPEDYDSWYEKEPGKTIDLIETDCVLSLLFPVNGRKILDAGCGTGNFTKKLSCLGFDVIGLEPDDKMREQAAKKGLKCVKGVVEDIPFEDGTFDAAISVTAIEFFQDKWKALSEMLRVVKEGGKVVIGTITGKWAEYYEELGKSGHKVFSHAKFPSVEELSKHPNFEKIKFCLRTSPGETPSFDLERSIKNAGFAVLLFQR